jgi:hypothetical protein
MNLGCFYVWLLAGGVVTFFGLLALLAYWLILHDLDDLD